MNQDRFGKLPHASGNGFRVSRARGSNIFDLGGVFSPERIFALGGGARYPLLCKFLARSPG